MGTRRVICVQERRINNEKLAKNQDGVAAACPAVLADGGARNEMQDFFRILYAKSPGLPRPARGPPAR